MSEKQQKKQVISRSSKVKLNYTNRAKCDYLFKFLDTQTTTIISNEINKLLYSTDTIKAKPDKDYTSTLPFSARINQLIAAEISSVVRSAKAKLKLAEKQGNKKKYQKELLEKYHNKLLNINWLGNLNLDERFVSIEENHSSVDFDYWIKIRFTGDKNPVFLPFKSTKHIKSLIERGYKLKTNTLRICRNNYIILKFEKEKQENNYKNQAVGIDVGMNKAFVTSRGEFSSSQIKTTLESLKKKKHGSKNKQANVIKMKQLIDKSVKDDINWSDVSLVVLEDLKHLKTNKYNGNKKHHWSYSYIQNRIYLLAEELDVQVQYVNPAYTSQECSSCGYSDKLNRSKEQFVCLSCGHELDADFNAAMNVLYRGIHSTHDNKNKIL